MDWTAMAAPWLRMEAETDQAHAPVLTELMRRADLKPGQSILDIGPGAGISLLKAAQAVGPSGKVTGIEIAPPFAERAQARTPDTVQVIVGNAADHIYRDAPFDVAISLFGVMFFENPEAAFAHIRKSLSPGADLHFACWGPPQHNPWFAMPARMASQVFGPGPSFDPDGPGPMALADPDKIAGILTAAGWKVEVDTQDLHLTPDGPPNQVADMHMNIGGGAHRMRLSKEAGTLTEAHKTALRALLVDGFADMVVDGAVRVPARLNFVRATA